MALFGLLKKKPATGEMPPVEAPRQEKTPERQGAKPEVSAEQALQKNAQAGEAARAHTETQLTASRDLLKRHGADSPEIDQKLEALTQKTEGLWGRFKKKMQDVADAFHTSLALGNASETDKAAYRTELKTARAQAAAEVIEGKKIFAETLPQAKIDAARAEKQKKAERTAPANELTATYTEKTTVAEATDEDLSGSRDASSGWFVGENDLHDAALKNSEKNAAAEQTNFEPDKYISPQFIDTVVADTQKLLRESEKFASLGRSEENFAAEEKRLQAILAKTEQDIREIKEDKTKIDQAALRENRQKNASESDDWHGLDMEQRSKVDLYNFTVDQLEEATTKQEARRDLIKRLTAERTELQTASDHLEEQKDSMPPALFSEKQALISSEINKIDTVITKLSSDERGALLQDVSTQITNAKGQADKKNILEKAVTQGIFESSGEEKNRRAKELLRRQAEAATTTETNLRQMNEQELRSYGDTLTRLGQGVQEILFQLRNNKNLSSDADLNKLGALVDHVYSDSEQTIPAIEGKRLQHELFDNLPAGAAGRQELKRRATAGLAEIQANVVSVGRMLKEKAEPSVVVNMEAEPEPSAAGPSDLKKRAVDIERQIEEIDKSMESSTDVALNQKLEAQRQELSEERDSVRSAQEKLGATEAESFETADEKRDRITADFAKETQQLDTAALKQKATKLEAEIAALDTRMTGSTDASANKQMEDDRLTLAAERDIIRDEQEKRGATEAESFETADEKRARITKDFAKEMKNLDTVGLQKKMTELEAKIAKIDRALEGSIDAYANKLLEDDRLTFATERDVVRAEQERQSDQAPDSDYASYEVSEEAEPHELKGAELDQAIVQETKLPPPPPKPQRRPPRPPAPPRPRRRPAPPNQPQATA